MDSWPNWLHWISFPQKHTIRLFYLPISSEWGEEGGWEVEQEISWMIWFPTLLKRLRMMRRRVSWCSTKKNRKESESSSFPHTTRFRSRGSFCWTGLGDKNAITEPEMWKWLKNMHIWQSCDFWKLFVSCQILWLPEVVGLRASRWAMVAPCPWPATALFSQRCFEFLAPF